MDRLAEVAQRLRQVRQAHQRFLALYAAEVAIVQPGLDRVAEDVFDNPESDLPDWLPPSNPDDGGGGPASLGW